MDSKETIKLYRSDDILLSDSNYYKYIFKKTEKIICVVFYALEHTDKSQKDTVVSSVLESAKRTLDSVLQTLCHRWYAAYDQLYDFLNMLISLQSNIRVAEAVGLLQEEVADMLWLEIDSVMRTLRQYLGREKRGAPDLSTFNSMSIEMSKEPMQQTPTPRVSTTPQTQTVSERRALSKGQVKGQRAERHRMIKDILASKRQSTIKDISEKVPKWSQKTIQREIISMINNGTITKEGERRWSKYSLASGV